MTRAVARVMDVMETTPATHARRAQAAPTVRSRCLTVVGAPEHDAGTAPPPWFRSGPGLTDPMSGTRGRRTRCPARGADHPPATAPPRSRGRPGAGMGRDGLLPGPGQTKLGI